MAPHPRSTGPPLAQCAAGGAGSRRPGSRVWPVRVAVAALGLGVLLYLVDRGSAPVQGLPALALPAAWAGLRLFGTLGQWLPSLLHVLAFSLLTAAALPWRAAPAYGACLAWCGVNLAFEAGQHPQLSAGLARGLYAVFGDTPLTRPLAGYFLRGTFDAGDIAAAVAGALLAAAVLRLFHRDLEADHAC